MWSRPCLPSSGTLLTTIPSDRVLTQPPALLDSPVLHRRQVLYPDAPAELLTPATLPALFLSLSPVHWALSPCLVATFVGSEPVMGLEPLLLIFVN